MPVTVKCKAPSGGGIWRDTVITLLLLGLMFFYCYILHPHYLIKGNLDNIETEIYNIIRVINKYNRTLFNVLVLEIENIQKYITNTKSQFIINIVTLLHIYVCYVL